MKRSKPIINIGGIKNIHLRRLAMIPVVAVLVVWACAIYLVIALRGALSGAIDAVDYNLGDGLDVAKVVADCWRGKP